MRAASLILKKYAENISWLIVEKGISLFVGALVGVYVARYLKPESYGLLNYSISFVSIFSALSTLGLDQIIVRELSRQPSARNELLGTGLMLKTYGSTLLIFIMACVMFFMHDDRITNTLIMIIASAEIFKSFEVVNYFFQSKVESKYPVRTQLFINVFSSLLKLLLVFFQAPLIWFAISIVVNSVLNSIGFIYTYAVRNGSPLAWIFRKELAFKLLSESWPLILYGVALHIQARIDQVMLGKMLNNYEVGQYSVALRFIEIFGFVPMALMNTFTPTVSRAKTVSEELYESRLLNLYRLMFVSFLIIAVPIYFFSEDLVMLLYGSDYQPAGYLLSLFALRIFFSHMGVGKSLFIVNESLFLYSLITVIMGAVTNITLNYFLIPILGPTGAIIASMLSFTVSIFLIDVLFEKPRRNQKLMIKGMTTFWKLNELFVTK
jgi:O-antigen/teichoic acid export membrane protein